MNYRQVIPYHTKILLEIVSVTSFACGIMQLFFYLPKFIVVMALPTYPL